MKNILELYWCFVKIGCVNFGGGYAMLPLLKLELDEKRHWVTSQELGDYYAVGQCTPGAIAMNVSTFIGYKLGGVLGAIAATMGFVTMPVVIITVIAACLQNFAEIAVVQHAFAGIRVCVCVLIFQAIKGLWKNSVVDKGSLALYILILILTLLSKVLPVSVPAAVLVIFAGVCGILFGKEGRKK